ncbi:hypothetical protein E2C01_077118 [Portunus trituberculatus]|uniref:Uncharacterized protein n=1 Tax=Portunus trituberculatus TaxID=210409 RepID=A0A5B7IDI9_PORTR|nr:hypothetical protein [Portunus trituberculatus]
MDSVFASILTVINIQPPPQSRSQSTVTSRPRPYSRPDLPPPTNNKGERPAPASLLAASALSAPAITTPRGLGAPAIPYTTPKAAGPAASTEAQGLLRILRQGDCWAGSSRGRRMGGLLGSSTTASPGSGCLPSHFVVPLPLPRCRGP